MGQTVQNIVLSGQDQMSGAVRSVESAFVRAQKAVDRFKATASATTVPLNSIQASATRSVTSVSAMSSAMENARTRVGATSGSLGQLSFQINDIASGLLMGQSPFQIMAQQGGQVLQIWQMNNNVFRELKDGVVALGARALATFGPLGIAGLFAGATAAAVYYFAEVRDGSGTATDHLKEEKAAIDAIKDAFSTASGAAKQFGADTQNVAIALANAARIKIIGDLNDQIKQLSKSLPATSKQITDAYRKALPGLPGLSQNFPKQVSGPSGAFEDAVNQFKASTAEPAEKVKQFADAVADVVNKSKDPAVVKFGGDLLKTADAARTSVKALNELDHAIAKPGETANHTSSKARHAFQDLIRSTQDQIAEFRLQAATAGQSGQAVDALKKKHELIKAAIKDGIPIQEALTRARLAGADADSFAAAKAEIRLAQLRSDMQFDRDQLGRSPEEQQVQSALRSAGLDPLSAIGSQTAAQMRFNQALTETRDLAKGALSTFVSDLQQGKSGADALRDAIGGITNKLLDMAENQAIAALFAGFGKGGGVGAPLSLAPPGVGGGFNLFSSIGHLFGFANGGEFTVGGSGGTDSQLVAFRASPDETVRISRPGQGGGSGGIIVHMPIQIDARGADQAAVVRIGQGLADLQKTLPKQIGAAVKTHQTRGTRY